MQLESARVLPARPPQAWLGRATIALDPAPERCAWRAGAGVGAATSVRGVAVAVTRRREPQGRPGRERPEEQDPEQAAEEDRELVRRCRAGEERAFERLFLRHRGPVTGLVFRMLGPSPELEDLVQDVFIQVLRSLGSFRDEARFSTWLYRVALNVALMHRRAAGRRPRLVDEDRAEPAVDAAPSAHEVLETRRRVEAFYALLGRLSDKKRTVYVLHELEGLSPARIAQIVQAPVLTVRTRLFYARRELADWIEEDPALAAVLAELPEQAAADAGEEQP
jgi:RNA polymerase sigma-70 factor (ECF subfamily)